MGALKAPGQPSSTRAPREPLRVLIVDDNIDLAQAIALALETRGARATVIGDGASALDVISRVGFDVALVDLLLPGVGGGEVLVAMRANHPERRLFAMTGYDRSQERLRMMEAKVEAVLRKPFDIPQLLRRLGLDAEAQAPRVARCRVAMLAPADHVPPNPPGCNVDRFTDPDTFREAIADHAYDAALVLQGGVELVEDVKALDRDLAVLTECQPALVAGGVERTRERREASRDLMVLQALFDRSATPMLVAAGDPPEIVRWNRELVALLGHRSEELRGAPVSILDDPDRASRPLSALVHDALAGEAEVNRRVPVRARGGSVRLVDARAIRVEEEDVAVAVSLFPHRSGPGHEEALRLVGATAAGVAHEMRNTLAGISSSLSIVRGRVPEGSTERQVLGRVEERIARAAEVMSDLLAYARPTTPRLKVVPLRMVLEAAAEQVRQGAVGTAIDVQVDVQDPTLRVKLDPVAIQMTLINLGLNAVQALGERGCVRIAGGREGDRVVLRVDDDGPGIPPEMRERVFEPFFTTRARGSGLGLANVRKVVEAHQGTVELLDGSPGAHFVLRLPPRPGEHSGGEQ